MTRFTMIGKLSIAGDRPNKPAFSDKLLDSGCNIRELNLQMKCDKDNFNLQIKSFMSNAKKNSDGSINVDNSIIYSLIKSEDGKYSTVQFKHKDSDKYIDNLAEFKKYVFVDGDDRLECSNTFDYATAVYTTLKSDAYKDKVFRVDGEIEYSNYKNPKTGIENTYTNYNVERIYLVNDDTEQKATCTLDVYMTADCIDDTDIEETGSFKLMCYIPQYMSKKKGEFGYYQVLDYPLNIDKDKQSKKFNALQKLLTSNFEDNELCKMGFKCNLINRIKEVDFDIETMISDEEKELLEFGIITESELEAKYGKGQGGRETKMEVEGITRGYTAGAIPVPLTLSQLLNKGDEELKENKILTSDENDDLDLFSNDDDEDELFDF